MNLEHLAAELDEFDDFVAAYSQSPRTAARIPTCTHPKFPSASQMNDIMAGNLGQPPSPKRVSPTIPLSTTEQSDPVAPAADGKLSLCTDDPASKLINLKKPLSTCIDYSRFEKIAVADDSESEQAPKPQPAQSKVSENPVKKPYSLKSQTPFKTISEKIAELSNASKLAGNAAIFAGNFFLAENHYTHAIEIRSAPRRAHIVDYDRIHFPKEKMIDDPFSFLDKISLPDPDPIEPDLSLYTNRAHARRGLRKFKGAITDCDFVISAPKSVTDPVLRTKAYWRRGFARMNLNQFSEALQDFETGSQLLQNSPKATNKPIISQRDIQKAISICREWNKIEFVDVGAVFSEESLMFQRTWAELCGTARKNLTSMAPDYESISQIGVAMSLEVSKLRSFCDFRRLNGFGEMFDDSDPCSETSTSLVNARSIHVMLPIIITACMKDDHNVCELSKNHRLTLIAKNIVLATGFRNDPSTLKILYEERLDYLFATNVMELFSKCSRNEMCMFAITSSIDPETIETWTSFLNWCTDVLEENPPTPVKMSKRLPSIVVEVLSCFISFDHTVAIEKWNCNVEILVKWLGLLITQSAPGSVDLGTVSSLSRILKVLVSPQAPIRLKILLEEKFENFVLSIVRLLEGITKSKYSDDCTIVLICLHNLLTAVKKLLPDNLCSESRVFETITKAVSHNSALSEIGKLSAAILAKLMARSPMNCKKLKYSMYRDLKTYENVATVFSRLQLDFSDENYVNAINNWMQVLVGLAQGDAGLKVIEEWKRDGGFKLLAEVAKGLSDEMQKRKLLSNHFVKLAGNFGLAAGECVKKGKC
ncbi:hypothetical protein HDU84_003946 [Entophlyctis sp. JEL0112]|nr:hypothetical protein HDU84_003946 [Entophlyctis sp. JEL0112]